jgi:uncharacterized membrane protein
LKADLERLIADFEKSVKQIDAEAKASWNALGAGAGAADASSWKDEFGIPEDFVQEVGVLIPPGDSAIYAILRVSNPDIVEDQFRGYGGTILSTTLSLDQQAKVEKVLAHQ